MTAVSPSCKDDVVFASGALVEEETDKGKPLPGSPDDWRWGPTKLERWCWTKFETCSKFWNRTCSGFAGILPEIRAGDSIREKKTTITLSKAQHKN